MPIYATNIGKIPSFNAVLPINAECKMRFLNDLFSLNKKVKWNSFIKKNFEIKQKLAGKFQFPIGQFKLFLFLINRINIE